MTKKISINAFEKAVEGTYTDYIDASWNDLAVTIKPTLDLAEMLAFVDGVVNACFNSDDMSYNPAAEDFAIRTAIIELYTNIRMPADVQKRYSFLYKTDIVEFARSYINGPQFKAMIDAVRKKTEHIANANIAATNKQLETLYATFENMQTQMEETFSKVQPDDIKNLIGAMGDGKIDEEKLVKAYLDNK